MSSASALNSLLSGSTSSTSGIDISSLLQAATGASTAGIDVTSAVNAAVTAAEAPEQAWQAQQATLQSQTNALTQLQSDATNLDNDMQSLNSLTGPLSARTVSTSDSTIVSASAASGSAVGNHVVSVASLASTASWASNTVASSTAALPAGTFSITGADGTVTNISTGTGSSTLNDVASEINNDNIGLTASVVTDATGARLAIESNTSGSANNFTVGSGGLNFTQAVIGVDAKLTVDGIAITSASNNVTGALPGITLNLLNASPGTNVSLAVAPDTTAAATAIKQFVTDYNQAMTDINTQFTDVGSGEGVLASDSVVRNLQSDLESALDYTYTPASGTTTVPNLSAMGISVQNNGTLTVDSSTLTNALQNNYSDVQNFFQGPALNGFANSLDQQLTSFTSPADGAFTVDLQSISTEYSGLQTDITNFQTNYITPLQAQLQAEYSQAEILLQQLPSQMAQINTELGYNNTSH
jgi:flagellar hook-associated protein 2